MSSSASGRWSLAEQHLHAANREKVDHSEPQSHHKRQPHDYNRGLHGFLGRGVMDLGKLRPCFRDETYALIEVTFQTIHISCLNQEPRNCFGFTAVIFGGPARIRTWNPRIWSPMLCQLELLTLVFQCAVERRGSVDPELMNLTISNFGLLNVQLQSRNFAFLVQRVCAALRTEFLD